MFKKITVGLLLVGMAITPLQPVALWTGVSKKDQSTLNSVTVGSVLSGVLVAYNVWRWNSISTQIKKDRNWATASTAERAVIQKEINKEVKLNQVGCALSTALCLGHLGFLKYFYDGAHADADHFAQDVDMHTRIAKNAYPLLTQSQNPSVLLADVATVGACGAATLPPKEESLKKQYEAFYGTGGRPQQLIEAEAGVWHDLLGSVTAAGSEAVNRTFLPVLGQKITEESTIAALKACSADQLTVLNRHLTALHTVARKCGIQLALFDQLIAEGKGASQVVQDRYNAEVASYRKFLVNQEVVLRLSTITGPRNSLSPQAYLQSWANEGIKEMNPLNPSIPGTAGYKQFEVELEALRIVGKVCGLSERDCARLDQEIIQSPMGLQWQALVAYKRPIHQGYHAHLCRWTNAGLVGPQRGIRGN